MKAIIGFFTDLFREKERFTSLTHLFDTHIMNIWTLKQIFGENYSIDVIRIIAHLCYRLIPWSIICGDHRSAIIIGSDTYYCGENPIDSSKDCERTLIP